MRRFVAAGLVGLLVAARALANEAESEDGSSGARPRVIVDFDPAGLIRTGLDMSDDLAFLQLLGTPGVVDLAGTTVVYGNAPLGHTAVDSWRLMRLGGVDEQVPRVKGADWTSRNLTGPNAAADFIQDVASMLPPRSLILVCLGPLTNVAAAFLRAPWLPSRLRAVYLAGGRLTPTALLHLDLNLIWADSEASNIVLAAPVPKVLIPRETCAQSLFTRTMLWRLEDCCPGSAACEYLPGLRASIRKAETDSWWDKMFEYNTDAIPRPESRAEPAAASNSAAGPPSRSAWPTGPTGPTGPTDAVNGDSKTTASPAAVSEPTIAPRASRDSDRGLELCDVVAMSTLLHPGLVRSWAVAVTLVAGWRMEIELLRDDLHTPAVTRALLDDANDVADPRSSTSSIPSTPSTTSASSFLPDSLTLRSPGVVLVPKEITDGPTLMRRAVDSMCMALHGEPHREMMGDYDDPGFLHPYVFWPIAIFVGSLLLGGVCCVGGCVVFCVRRWTDRRRRALEALHSEKSK